MRWEFSKPIQIADDGPWGRVWKDYPYDDFPSLDEDPSKFRVKPEQAAAPEPKEINSEQVPPPEILEIVRAIERVRESGLIKAGMLGVVYNTPRATEIDSFYSFHYDKKDQLLDLLYVLMTTAIPTQMKQFTSR